MNSLRFFVVVLMALSVHTSAEVKDSNVSVEALIEASLKLRRPGLTVRKIEQSPIPGYYLVETSADEVIYMNATAEHFFAGDLIFLDGDGFVNVTEKARESSRKKLLDSIDESEMLVYSPAPERVKTTITVFTDIDCGYCRKLHREIPELNKLGIAVRYLAYPRAGIGSNSYTKIVSAWCADNPNVALTKAKAGQEIETRTCSNPVASHYGMGDQFGVTGTPAIIYEDGRLQPGYVPAIELARRLGIN